MTNNNNMHPYSEQQASNQENDTVLKLPAVVDGEIIPIEEIEDPIFADKIIGEGFGIRPTGKTIYSPVNGKVEQIASTKHAIYLSTSNNIKLLIHIGLDTIELKGKGFTSNIKKDMIVQRGDKLVEIDPKFIMEEGYNPVVAVVLLNRLNNSEVSVYLTKEAIGNETIAFKIALK